MAIDLRFATPEDAAGIVAIYAPFCTSSSVTFETSPPTPAQMAERITNVTATYPWLVAESANRILGYAYATRFRERAAYRWTAEVAIYVDPETQHRGIGRALYTTLFSLLSLQGFAKAVAGITVPNASSVALHERMGFEHTGIFPGVGYKEGAWLDVGWWQLGLRPQVARPADPIPLPEIYDKSALAELLAQGRRLANR